MAATFTATTTQPILDTTQSTQVVRGFITLSGSYTAGGDTVSFGKYPTQSAQTPTRVLILEQPATGTLPSGLLAYYRPGTNPSNGKIQFLTPAVAGTPPTQGTELPAAAYPSYMTASKFFVEAVFPLGL